MPYPIKQSFGGGELSPRVRGHSTQPYYDTGMQFCENWLVDPQGDVRLRPGTRYVIDAKSTSSRLIEFNRERDESYMLELSDQSIRFLNTNGLVKGENIIKNPLFDDIYSSWNVTSYGTELPVNEPGNHVNFRPSTTIASMPIGNLIQLDQRSSQTGAIDPRLATDHLYQGVLAQKAIHPDKPNLQNYNIEVKALRGVAAGDLWIKVGSSLGAFDNVDQIVTPPIFSESGEPESFVFTFSSTTDIFVEVVAVSSVGQGTGLGAKDNNQYVFSTKVFGGIGASIELATPYLQSDVSKVQTAAFSSGNVMFFAHPDHPIQELVLDRATTEWVFQPTTIVEGIAPNDLPWAENNYPSAIAAYQGRLLVAATRDQPSTLWGSKTLVEYIAGDDVDFTFGVNDGDAYEYNIATSSKIQWIVGNKHVLNVGTDDSEWVGFGSNGTITPSDAQFERHSSFGSLDVEPERTGDQIIYAGFDGGRLFAVNFDGDQTNTWVASEITFFAEHLFQSKVRDYDYAYDPNFQLYCVTTDGNMFVGTYDRKREVQAWVRWKSADADYVNSVSVLNTSIGSAVFLNIIREGKGYIEAFVGEESAMAFLDSYVRSVVSTLDNVGGSYSTAYNKSYSGSYFNTNKYAAGFERYNGQTVSVVIETDLETVQPLLNDVVPSRQTRLHPDVEVIDGRITLESWAKGYAVVGIPYKAKLETLPQENTFQQGTAQGTKRRNNRIFARLSASAMPLLNGHRPNPDPEDIPTGGSLNIDNKLEAYANGGDYEIRDIGYDDGVIIIEQDLPIRTQVSGVFGKERASAT